MVKDQGMGPEGMGQFLNLKEKDIKKKKRGFDFYFYNPLERHFFPEGRSAAFGR